MSLSEAWEILDGNDDFNNYVVVGYLRATNNFGCLGVQCHVMTSYDNRVVSRLYHNNKEWKSIINLLHTISKWILISVIVTNQRTTVTQNLNTLCTQRLESIYIFSKDISGTYMWSAMTEYSVISGQLHIIPSCRYALKFDFSGE